MPSDFFSYVGVRQFFAHAYPYTTIQNTINTVDGVEYDFPQHGAIPQYMANFYPTNVTWPSGTPSDNASQAGSAAWWWMQSRTNSSSPFYDPELAACTPSAPCEFPVVGVLGEPNVDEIYSDWESEVARITNGAVKADTIDLSVEEEEIDGLFSGASKNPLPIFWLGWAPDYPDPTDYTVPIYGANGLYPSSDAVAEALIGAGESNATYSNPYWAQSCATADTPSTPLVGADLTNLIAYAKMAASGAGAGTPGVAQACSGAAYSEMQWGLGLAASETNAPERVLLYNLVEQIDSGLQLYTWLGQQNAVVSYAPWINPATLDPNITLNGYDNPWFLYGGNGILQS